MRAVMSFRSAEAEPKEARDLGPLTIGTRINQFEIRSILGEGGTAVVYEAVHTRLNSSVALKVVNMRGPYGPNAAARLRREAELCAAVEDPHVPKVYDVGALPDGTPYLVMEKIVGPTLESLLMRGRLGLRLGTLILRDLLRAVEAVHRAGVVHRDIKPSNIIVQFASDRTPNVRLMDFGVSRSLFFRKGTSAALTRRGTILGTPEYMAPEQIQDQLTDVRTDVYALGVVSYEMFAGRAPFEAEHPAEVIAAVLRREHKPLSAHRPEVPAELETLIRCAMESAPAQRFKHTKAMRQELEAKVARALWVPVSSTLGIAAPMAAVALAKRKAGTPWGVRLIVRTSLALALCAGVVAMKSPPAGSILLGVNVSGTALPPPFPVVEVAEPKPSPTAVVALAAPASLPTASPLARTENMVIEPEKKPQPSVAASERNSRRENRAHLHTSEARVDAAKLEVEAHEQDDEARAAELPNPVEPRDLEQEDPSLARLEELREVVLKSPFDTADATPKASSARAQSPLPLNPYAE